MGKEETKQTKNTKSYKSFYINKKKKLKIE